MTNIVQSAESLYMEKELLHQTKLRKPDLEYSSTDITGYMSCLAPCAGTYSFSNRETSLFSEWSQKPEEMIDPTQQNIGDSDMINNNTGTRKNGQTGCDLFAATEDDAKIMKKMNTMAKDNIKVSNCIVFTERDTDCGFQGKIFISNICDDYITYRVCSSNSKKFRYVPDNIGWVAPGSRREIFVQTNRQETAVFEDIVKDAFLVQSTPIYRKEQLEMACLNLLWNAFGSDVFPKERCEQHLIKDVYPSDEKYLDNFSIVGRLKFAFFKKTDKIEEPPSGCSECSFYEQWPMNSLSISGMKEQMERSGIVLGTVKEVEKANNSISSKLIYVYFMIAASVGISAVTFAFYYDSNNLKDHVCSVFTKCLKP